MPTFINEAVLSLPEQVEKNKKDIKAIEETIGGIDPNLINQVQTNTSDISAIKGEQTLQNTAINNNTNKTQNINADGTKYSNVETLENANGVLQIKGNGVSIENDDATEIVTPNANINISNSGVIEISNDNNANKLEYDMANGSFKVSGGHTLEFDSTTGDLKIDGGAVGGEKLFQHYLTLDNNFYVILITNVDVAFTISTLATWLQEKGAIGTQAQSPFRRLYSEGRIYTENGLNVITLSGGSATVVSSISDVFKPIN